MNRKGQIQEASNHWSGHYKRAFIEGAEWADSTNSLAVYHATENHKLEQKLAIAVEALEFYATDSQFSDGTPMTGQMLRDMDDYGGNAREALEKIREGK